MSGLHGSESHFITPGEAEERGLNAPKAGSAECPWCGRVLEPRGVMLNGRVAWVAYEPCGCDGEVAAVCTTSEEDGWKYSFGRLPADDGYGNVYTYKLREDGVEGYFARIDGMNVTNTRITDFEMSGLVPKSSTPLSRLASLTEAEMDGLMDVLGYGTPLFGMLDTGDETPLYPFLFGGAGLLALAMLLALRKRRGR